MRGVLVATTTSTAGQLLQPVDVPSPHAAGHDGGWWPDRTSVSRPDDVRKVGGDGRGPRLAPRLTNTAEQDGGALGLAVWAPVADDRVRVLRAHGASLPSALTGGDHHAFMAGAGLILVGVPLAEGAGQTSDRSGTSLAMNGPPPSLRTP